jgi:hypothetical protein
MRNSHSNKHYILIRASLPAEDPSCIKGISLSVYSYRIVGKPNVPSVVYNSWYSIRLNLSLCKVIPWSRISPYSQLPIYEFSMGALGMLHHHRLLLHTQFTVVF